MTGPAPVERWRVMAGTVPYAERDTRAEAEAVLEEQRHLIEHFGPGRVERSVIPLRPAGRT